MTTLQFSAVACKQRLETENVCSPVDSVSLDLPPFTHVGVDYFGPIQVKQDCARMKRWRVIFSWMVCWAIHLESIYLDTDLPTGKLLGYRLPIPHFGYIHTHSKGEYVSELHFKIQICTNNLQHQVC